MIWVIFTEQRDAHAYPRLFASREAAERVLREEEGLMPVPPPHYPEGYAWTSDGDLRNGPVWMLDTREIEGDAVMSTEDETAG